VRGVLPKKDNIDWKKWLEHWDTQTAIVGTIDVPKCGLFGCDEKVKINGNRWKCTACGKITKAEQG
jgi:hypothetical protein